VFEQVRGLAKHSVVYGVGSLVTKIIAVFLLPLYTKYLDQADYGAIETLLALSTVLSVVLSLGTPSAFFRFYFDSDDPLQRLRVVRTAFWAIMAGATAGLAIGWVAAPLVSDLLFGTRDFTELVRASFIGLWAQMNYQQLVNLFRVEQRSVQFVVATLINAGITIGLTIVLVVVLGKGPLGVIVGNFIGTLIVYTALIAHHREQLGLSFDRALFREMNAFGMPLVPSALFLWTMNFADRLFLVKLTDAGSVGLYSVGVRIASALMLLLAAFRMAWPAFAFSIRDDAEAKRTYAAVLTYLMFVVTWISLALSVLAPWIVAILTAPRFQPAADVVPALCFSFVPFAAYIVVVIGIGRVRRTRSNWIVTGVSALTNVVLCLALIPPFGIQGAALATVGAYGVMFAGMAWRAQRLFPVPYEWRRVITLIATCGLVSAAAAVLHPPLAVALVLAAGYPVALLALGFYRPHELRRLRALRPRSAVGTQ
jgi:O-antigen/teichoic acid export membrane protein